MEMIFNSPRVVRRIQERIIPEKITTATGITITQMIDNPVIKTVEVSFITSSFNRSIISSSVVLWSGNEYDEIGQWTDEDVIERLNEIFQPLVTTTTTTQ